MSTRTQYHETIDDLRSLDLFAEVIDGRDEDGNHVSNETSELCRTILLAADVLKRTIIAAHDAQQRSREYNP